MKPTVGSIFRDHFEDYNQRYPQPLFKLKAVSDLSDPLVLKTSSRQMPTNKANKQTYKAPKKS